MKIFPILFLLAIACSDSTTTAPSSSSEELDPFFALQWHLRNNGSNGAVSGEDINVASVWADGNRGEGVLVSVVDDGLEINHEDLRDNILLGSSINYSTGSDNPTPTDTTLGHGTAVAGLIAAVGFNFSGGRGVAPAAKVVGYNSIATARVIDIADSLSRLKENVHVSNNSWGFTDGTGRFNEPNSLIPAAIASGIADGRGGKGSIYVFSAGNCGNTIDKASYDGQLNSRYVIPVGAVGDDGIRAVYTEPGPNVWISAYSKGTSSGKGLVTTDLSGTSGYNAGSGNLVNTNYTNNFSGTSGSAPLVSGVAALVVKANQNLTWRDVKIILAQTAKVNDETDSNWGINNAGVFHNDFYGFGVVDANAAVETALTWTNVSDEITETYTSTSNSITVSGSSIAKIEYVNITLTLSTLDWGTQNISLQRVGAITTTSQLAAVHDCFNTVSGCVTTGQTAVNCTVGDDIFEFGTVKHFNETADGTWQLNLSAGGLTTWTLTIHGRAS